MEQIVSLTFCGSVLFLDSAEYLLYLTFSESFMSIAGISSTTLLQPLLGSVLRPVTTSKTSQARSASAFKIGTIYDSTDSSSESAIDPLTQDLVVLLKTLSSGDTIGAKAGLTKLQRDTKSVGASSGQAGVTKDFTSLITDLALGNAIAVKSDLTQLTTDLTAQTSDAETDTPQSQFEILVSKLSDLLNSGSTNGALQAVASYLVQQGLGNGSLVNTSA